jgi:hypothetical protein
MLAFADLVNCPKEIMPNANKQGRPKGAKNKRTKAVETAVSNSGITPLEYMLNVLRDDLANPEDRKWAAQSAAPYVHAKLASSEVKMEAKVGFEDAIGSAGKLLDKLRQSDA